MSIQPEEGIVLGFQAKYPGPKMQLRPVEMRFNYRESFDAPSPDAYETLLWDVMKNDATLVHARRPGGGGLAVVDAGARCLGGGSAQ